MTISAVKKFSAEIEFLDKTNEFSFMLKPSTIEGVGVFALHNICKGTLLQLFPEPPSRKKPLDYISEFTDKPWMMELLQRYSIDSKDALYLPPDLSRMSIGCYLNHSDQPNAHHHNYIYYASRDILSGEEITIDYSSLA